MNMRKLLSATLALACIATPVFADQTVTATRTGTIHVTYNGAPQKFVDSTGAEALPIIYQGTTYLPLSAVASIAGLGVKWDQETKSVLLTTGGTVTTSNGTQSTSVTEVPVVLSSDITVSLDGQQQDATPLIYNGTTYLPLSTVCNLAGLPVTWFNDTRTVALGNSPTPATDRKVLTGADVKFTSSSDTYSDGLFYFAVPSTFSEAGPYKTTFTVNTDGYEYIRLTIPEGPYPTVYVYDTNGEVLGHDRLGKSGHVAYIKVAGSDVVTVQIGRRLEAPETIFSEIALENAPVIPKTVIPEGAIAVTPDMAKSKHHMEYTADNTYICENSGSTSTGASITLQLDGKYKTLALTFTSRELPHQVLMNDMSKFNYTTLCNESVEAGCVSSFTVNVTGVEKLELSIRSGSAADGVISSLYLTK